jgi:hypothetical protein
MENAKQYFNHHNAAQRLYFTSDDLAFFDEQNAMNHAKHLEDQAITSMTREEVDKKMESMLNDEWDDDTEDMADELSGQ